MLKRPTFAFNQSRTLMARARGSFEVVVWGLESADPEKPSLSLNAPGFGLAALIFRDDRELVGLTRDGLVVCWSLEGEVDGGLKARELWRHAYRTKITAAKSFLRDDSVPMFVAGDTRGFILIIDVSGPDGPGTTVGHGHTDAIVEVVVDASGRRLASSGRDLAVCVWPLRGKKLYPVEGSHEISAQDVLDFFAVDDPPEISEAEAAEVTTQDVLNFFSTAYDAEASAGPSASLEASESQARQNVADKEGDAASTENDAPEGEVFEYEVDSELPDLLDAFEGTNSEVEVSIAVESRNAPSLPSADLIAPDVLSVEKRLAGIGGWVLCLEFSHSADKLVAGGIDNGVYLWDLDAETSDPVSVQYAHYGWVVDVAWAPDDTMIASASWDTTIGLFDIELTPTLCFEGHTDYVSSLIFTGNSRLMSASFDSTIKVWNWRQPELKETRREHTDWIEEIAPLDSGLVSLASDGTTSFWTTDGELERKLGRSSGAGIEVGQAVDLSEYVDTTQLASYRTPDAGTKERSSVRYADRRSTGFGGASGRTAMGLLEGALEMPGKSLEVELPDPVVEPAGLSAFPMGVTEAGIVARPSESEAQDGDSPRAKEPVSGGEEQPFPEDQRVQETQGVSEAEQRQAREARGKSSSNKVTPEASKSRFDVPRPKSDASTRPIEEDESKSSLDGIGQEPDGLGDDDSLDRDGPIPDDVMDAMIDSDAGIDEVSKPRDDEDSHDSTQRPSRDSTSTPITSRDAGRLAVNTDEKTATESLLDFEDESGTHSMPFREVVPEEEAADDSLAREKTAAFVSEPSAGSDGVNPPDSGIQTSESQRDARAADPSVPEEPFGRPRTDRSKPLLDGVPSEAEELREPEESDTYTARLGSAEALGTFFEASSGLSESTREKEDGSSSESAAMSISAIEDMERLANELRAPLDGVRASTKAKVTKGDSSEAAPVVDVDAKDFWSARPEKKPSAPQSGIVRRRKKNEQARFEREFEIRTPHAHVYGTALSPDGELVASCGADNSVCVWRRSGDKVHWFRVDGEGVNCVAFSPDGELLGAGCDDGVVHVWLLREGGLRHTRLEGHDSWVSSVTFSADSRYLISSSYDGTARVWKLERGECLGTLQGHDGPVSAVAFSVARSLTAGHDGTVRVWNPGWIQVDHFDGYDKLLDVATIGVISAWCSADGEVFLLDSDHPVALLRHRGEARSVFLREDGTLLSLGADGQLMVYHRGQREPHQGVRIDAPGWCVSAAATSVVCGADDGKIYVLSQKSSR